MDDLHEKMIVKNRDRIAALERSHSGMDGKLDVILILIGTQFFGVIALIVTIISYVI